MGKFIDLTGQRFGYLTAVEYVGNSRWRVKCDCGNETIVRIDNLKTGNTTSCGCFHISENRKPKKHAWHISDLKIYDTPKELSEFAQYKKGIYLRRCKKWDEDCRYYDFEDDVRDCGLCTSYNDLCPLTRPFQSWGYVAEGEA